MITHYTCFLLLHYINLFYKYFCLDYKVICFAIFSKFLIVGEYFGTAACNKLPSLSYYVLKIFVIKFIVFKNKNVSFFVICKSIS
jgi:hypothetical protein